MNVTPLPRSLDPLPAESLPGYVLRLAHRLGLTPARVALRTGLKARRESTMGASMLLALDPSVAARFADATRLTVDEVAGLTLSSLASRYPPLNPEFLGRHRQIHGVFIKENWVFSQFTRYCPDCLAGDGSLIQQRHGGAWSKMWRLPVVFACPTHRRLLRHTCPACGNPAHARRAETAELLPLASHPVTHPAACRNATNTTGPFHPCAHRLDQGADPMEARHEPGRDQHGLLLFQQRLVNLLDAGPVPEVVSVEQGTTPARYFVDLRILCCLLQASWPAGRDLTAQLTPVEPVDEHVQMIRQRIEAARSSGRNVHEIRLYDRPPPDAIASAILLAMADRILSDSPTTARQILRQVFRAAPFTRKWTRTFLTGDGYCSPGLQAVAGIEAGAQHVIRRAGLQVQRAASAPRPVGFSLTHVPQYLPAEWYHDHFGAFVDIPERFLRRAVCVLLVRISAGGSLRRAGPLLGLPWGTSRYAVMTVARELGDQSRRGAFDTALNALCQTLSAATKLIDYRRRREALAGWSITPQQWHSMTVDLIGKPVNGRPACQTDWGDRKRLLASVWVWTQVTQGEPYFAPHLRPDPRQPKPGGDLSVYIHSRWRLITAGYGHYAELRRRLDAHANSLAKQVDAP